MIPDLKPNPRFNRTPLYRQQVMEAIFVRHELSAGNLAQKLIREGKVSKDDQQRLAELLRKDWNIPLVSKGVERAKQLGEQIAKDPLIDLKSIDAFICSNYRRTRETLYYTLTAAGVDPKKLIELNPTVGERDWGDHHLIVIDNPECSSDLRIEDPYTWMPENGETIRFARERVQHIFSTINRRFGGKRVMIFTHGEFIITAKSELLRTYEQEEFGAMIKNGIPNGGLLQFSRLSPDGEESKEFSYYRQFAVSSSERHGDWSGSWQEVSPKKYNLDLILLPPNPESAEIIEILDRYQK